ncbi:hypothetical protein VCRA217O17_70273 [Vibrio crassostreae]|nr:hypothetical protein VCRA217O17_70273 [Vibrio crassostreae]
MFRLQEGFRLILSDNLSLYSILLYVDSCEIMVHVKQKNESRDFVASSRRKTL